jgi:hypothetical protein
VADQVEAKLTEWGTVASDDNDLRTEAGVQAYANRYAEREGVTIAVALKHVRTEVERRRAMPITPRAAVPGS